MIPSAKWRVGAALSIAFVLESCVLTVPGRAAEEPTELARAAYAFLNKYCSECHHGEKPKSNVKDYDVLDYGNLTKKRMRGTREIYHIRSDLKGADALKESRLWKRAGTAEVAGAAGDMPPDEAAAKPTDEEREGVLRKWIEAGAPPWPKGSAQKPEETKPASSEGELWFEVRDILERRCMKCHDGPTPQSGVPYFQVVVYQSLTRKWSAKERADRITDWSSDPWYYVQKDAPGEKRLDESLLWHMVKTDKMPRGSEKLTAGEKVILKSWIVAGAPVPPAPQERPYLSQQAQTAALVKHLRSKPEEDRSSQRYLTFAHLHNNRAIYETDLRTYRAGLAKLINSLSWKPDLVIPEEVPDTYKAVFAVDLRGLGWDERNLWDTIRQKYPYVLYRDAPEAAVLEQLSGTPVPCVRADWFVTRASRPPLYHQILDLPESAGRLEERLGINYLQNFRANNLARAGYLGASTTTSGFRVVERQAIVRHPGAYWKSYDFGSGELTRGGPSLRNPLVFCLGPSFPENPFPEKAFLHDGNEVIFNLPNGLQAYLVTDGDGRRVDAPPIWILKDRNEFSGTPQLVNGISCIACHAQGMQSVSDQVLTQSEKGGRAFDTPETRLKVRALYPPKEKMDQYLKGDEKRFLDAVRKVTAQPLTDPKGRLAMPKVEMIYAVTVRYRQPLSLEEAAREMDYEKVETLKAGLEANPDRLKGLGIQNRLMQEGGKISREEWAGIFAEVARRLKRH